MKKITHLALFLWTFNFAFAEQVTVTFMNPVPSGPTGTCGQSWSENGIPLKIINAAGYGGPVCNVTYGGGNLILQEGSALSIDLSSLGIINSVKTQFVCNCSGSCLGMWLRSGGSTLLQTSNSLSGQLESKTVFNSSGLLLDEFVVNICDDTVILYEIMIDYEPLSFSNRKIDFTDPVPDAPVGDTDSWVEVGIPLSVYSPGGSSDPIYGNSEYIMDEGLALEVDLSGIDNISSITTAFQNNTNCLNFKYFSNNVLIDEINYNSFGSLTEVFSNENLEDIDLMRILFVMIMQLYFVSI